MRVKSRAERDFDNDMDEAVKQIQHAGDEYAKNHPDDTKGKEAINKVASQTIKAIRNIVYDPSEHGA